MTTIVNNPVPVQSPAPERGGSGLLIGVLTLVVFVALFLYFGVPAIRRMSSNPIEVNVQTPAVTMPDKIDVNVTPAE
ncbi:MAG: hypothetical protein WC243_02675 [Patescibacteria group bacterium]|jgi:hypothetical protein